MLGYQLAANEAWISDFNKFIERKLLNLYTDNEFDRLSTHWGGFIFENQKSDAEGLAFFFSTLKEYKNTINTTQVGGT
jgi:hypothetical protein